MIILRGVMADELNQRRRAVARKLENEKQRLKNLRRDYKELPKSGLGLSHLEREVFLRQQVVGALKSELSSGPQPGG